MLLVRHAVHVLATRRRRTDAAADCRRGARASGAARRSYWRRADDCAGDPAADPATARTRAAYHHRDRRHGLPPGGVRLDEYQPEAFQLHARGPLGGAARAPAHPTGDPGGADGTI